MADTKPRFGFDEKGLGADAVVRELDAIARAEDAVWADGRCSGTIYCGDRAIYDLIAEAYGHFSYVNVLQRDMCPSQTRFESEIIAMTLDMLHGDAARERGLEPCGVIGSGGSESIISAIYTHREWGRAEKDITAPEMILPETAHVAFDKGAHYFGVKVIPAPVDPVTTLVDVDFVRKHINRNTVLLVGSAGNYPYGTIDPIGGALGSRRRARRRPARRRLPGRLHPALGRTARLRDPALRLPAPRASRRSRPTRTSTATDRRAPRCWSSATRRCGATSTSRARTGRVACTHRPASAAAARAA